MTQLIPIRMSLAEGVRNCYRVVPENATPFEALLDPAYWAHVSAKLRPTDKIEVEAEDGSYTALLIVRDAGRLYAKVAVVYYVKLDPVEVGAAAVVPSEYSVSFKGPLLKWCVTRGKDRLREGMGSRGEADAWLQEHLKNVAPQKVA